MKKILVMDSGSGGVLMLKSFLRAGVSGNFLMFCDQKNLPYGGKTPEALQQIALENLRFVRSFFPFEIAVFACNTLSCTALSLCRSEFKQVQFIGTVPAVKPALEKFRAEDVLVLGTPVTLMHSELIQKTPNLQLLAMPNLASQIDENLDDLSVLEPFLREQLGSFHPRAVVLGCTHYVAVKDMIANITGAEIFDSSGGVTRRLQHLLGENEQNVSNAFSCGVSSEKNTQFAAFGEASAAFGEEKFGNLNAKFISQKNLGADFLPDTQVQVMVSGNDSKLPLFCSQFLRF